MGKFTKQQIEKIKETQTLIADLAKQQDKAHDQLVVSLGFEKYDEAWKNDSDGYVLRQDNPADWLFDLLFNTQDEDIDTAIKNIEERWGMYDSVSRQI